MLTKNHETLTVEVEKHITADAVVQGNYWDGSKGGSKGCFIGCLAHSSDAFVLEEKFGLPLPLVKICESVFEALPEDEAKAFFAAIPAAVGYDGKDLSRVHWGFLASELRALPEAPAKQQAAVDHVIEGMDSLFSGGGWDQAAASAAAHAAARAAHAAADAAHAAARAAHAADAADAASAAAHAAYAA